MTGECHGGILVLHSWWGLNAFFRRLCDRFAQEGFVALAPDLYDGKVAASVAEAKALRARATASRREPAYRQLMGATAELREAAAVDAVGVVGYSMGGHWAYWLAQRADLPVTSTVTFYAARGGDYSASRSDFLAHFAETDEWVSPASVKKLKRDLAKAGRPCQSYVYPGTTHWFVEEDRADAYRPDAAALAWERTVAFLRRTPGRDPTG